jgi:poly-gamma-glutamate synthase PgsB/CapB
MQGFDYIEIPENVGLALDVCESVGVDRAIALRGMYKVTPDVGAATRHVLRRDGKEIDFYNVFAANDQESTAMVWKLIGLHEPGEHSTVVLISNRGDRLRRAVDMADTIAQDVKADWYVVAGDSPDVFIRLATRRGVPREKLIEVGHAKPASVLDRLFELTPRRAAVMGIGNIGGFGMKFMQLMEKERVDHAS